MRRRKRYGLGFALVLLAAVAGFWAARDMAAGIQPPKLAVPAEARQLAEELDALGLLTRLLPSITPAVRPTPTRSAQPAIVQGIEPAATPVRTSASPTPTGASTPTLAAPADVEYAFVLAEPVRHDNACGAASIRGSVRDAAGNLLAGVRLWRYDQWGNEEVRQSEGGALERGRFAFAIGDSANTHYVQVIDAGGVIISPVIEIPHRQGDIADALCHWVDWQQR